MLTCLIAFLSLSCEGSARQDVALGQRSGRRVMRIGADPSAAGRREVVTFGREAEATDVREPEDAAVVCGEDGERDPGHKMTVYPLVF